MTFHELYSSLQAYDPLTSAIVGVFGLLIGSFLNVVIHRLPIMLQRNSANRDAAKAGLPIPFPDRYDLSYPRSGCPHCGHKITAIENIPVLSYLALRGSCRGCGASISPRYPFIEILTASISAYVAWILGISAFGIEILLYLYICIPLIVIVIDHMLQRGYIFSGDDSAR